MDLSQLKPLGEVAGIGGIALGVVVLVLRPLIRSIAGLPKDSRAGPVKLIAIGCFVIGGLGIAGGLIVGVLLAVNLQRMVHALEHLLGFKFLDARVYFMSDLPAYVQVGDLASDPSDENSSSEAQRGARSPILRR